MADDASHLVIAIAISYPLQTYRAFVSSLRSHYFGAATLVTNATCEAARRYCYQKQVTLLSGSAARRLGLNDSSKMHVMASRFIVYARACVGRTLCLACDFRDIYFQANPFPPLAAWRTVDLLVPTEHRLSAGSAIRKSPINFNALRACIPDPKELTRVESSPVLNAGALYGTPRAFDALATLFDANMHRLSYFTQARYRVQCNDQALFNAFVHLRMGRLQDLQIQAQPRGTGAVHTLYEVSRRPWTLPEVRSADGRILNVDGRLSQVVHMWDRLPTRYLRNLSVWRAFGIDGRLTPCIGDPAYSFNQ